MLATTGTSVSNRVCTSRRAVCAVGAKLARLPAQMDPNIDDILPAEETETSAREFIEDLGSVGLGNADPRLKESIENFLALCVTPDLPVPSLVQYAISRLTDITKVLSTAVWKA